MNKYSPTLQFLSYPFRHFTTQELDSIFYGISCLQDRSSSSVVGLLLDPILLHPHKPLRVNPVSLMEFAAERNHLSALEWMHQNLEQLKVKRLCDSGLGR